MKRLLGIVRNLLAGTLVVALLAVTVIFVLSERRMGRSYDVAGLALELPTDPASVEEGLRLARLRGCYDGCHGAAYGGEVFLEEPFPFSILLGRMNSPDLTVLAAERTDAELERSIRHGVNQDGKTVRIMPSEMFARLSDEDLARILASIRAAPRTDGPGTAARIGPMARYFVLTNDFPLAAELIDHTADPPARTPSAGVELGEYLASTMCAECHGHDLRGLPAVGPMAAVPALSIVAGYTPDQFRRLMREGVPASGVELDLMRQVAMSRFTHMTDAEVGALYAYLNRQETWAAGMGPEDE